MHSNYNKGKSREPLILHLDEVLGVGPNGSAGAEPTGRAEGTGAATAKPDAGRVIVSARPSCC